MPNSIADELLEVLQAHRENRLNPPPVPPEPVWTEAPNGVQWQGHEGDEGQTHESLD